MFAFKKITVKFVTEMKGKFEYANEQPTIYDWRKSKHG
jgi:hypothetical protein